MFSLLCIGLPIRKAMHSSDSRQAAINSGGGLVFPVGVLLFAHEAAASHLPEDDNFTNDAAGFATFMCAEREP